MAIPSPSDPLETKKERCQETVAETRQDAAFTVMHLATKVERCQETVDLALPDGGRLQGNFSYTNEPGTWAVLYVHGFSSVRQGEKGMALEMACGLHGYTYAAFDFRGHGASSGTLLDLRGGLLLEDLEAIRNELARRGCQRLCLVGSSMGGWASAWFALRHRDVIPACVLIAPALDFLRTRWESLTEAERLAWKRTGRLRVRNDWVDTEIGYGLAEEVERYPLAELTANLRTPLLIFHGMKDNIIPYEQSLRLVQHAVFTDIELRLLRAGDHRLTAWKEEIAESACTFFARYMLSEVH